MTSNNDQNPDHNTSEGVHLVMLVHGINTRALWMNNVMAALKKEGFEVEPTSYGQYGITRFLIPIPSLHRKAIDRVLEDIRTAIHIHKPARTSIIAHSFGTFVVSKIIAENPHDRWHRIIFCGSVVREDFPLQHYLERFKYPMLNEIGTRDYWPALAESITWGYGSVGSTGFNRPPVRSRWHNGFRHSDFLTKEFSKDFWAPFLRNGEYPPKDEPSDIPWWIRIITIIPLRWVIPILILSLILLIASFIFSTEDCRLCGSLTREECERLAQLLGDGTRCN